MQRVGQWGTWVGIRLGMAVLALVAQALPAFAAGDAGVTFTAGSLSGGAITYGDFAGITLTGEHQATTATWSIANIADARGNGNGWNLSLTLTQLTEYNTGTNAYISGGKTLPTSSITVSIAPAVTQVDLSSSASNTITPVSVGTALDTGSPVKLLSAALNGGMGEFAFGAMTISLATAANAFARSYKTDATVSLNDAP